MCKENGGNFFESDTEEKEGVVITQEASEATRKRTQNERN